MPYPEIWIPLVSRTDCTLAISLSKYGTGRKNVPRGVGKFCRVYSSFQEYLVCAVGSGNNAGSVRYIMVIVGTDPEGLPCFRSFHLSPANTHNTHTHARTHTFFLSLSHPPHPFTDPALSLHVHSVTRGRSLTSRIRDYRSSNAVQRVRLGTLDGAVQEAIPNPLWVRFTYFVRCWFRLPRAIGSPWKYSGLTNPGSRFPRFPDATPEIGSDTQLLIYLRQF